MDRPEHCAHRDLLYDYIKFTIVRKNLDMAEFKRLYLEENQTASQIGEKFGVSKQMVLSRLRRAGISRTPGRDVSGSAKGSDLAEVQQFARNDIKNNTAALGGNLVKLDTNAAGNAMDWTGRNQVALSGRAFDCKK